MELCLICSCCQAGILSIHSTHPQKPHIFISILEFWKVIFLWPLQILHCLHPRSFACYSQPEDVRFFPFPFFHLDSTLALSASFCLLFLSHYSTLYILSSFRFHQVSLFLSLSFSICKFECNCQTFFAFLSSFLSHDFFRKAPSVHSPSQPLHATIFLFLSLLFSFSVSYNADFFTTIFWCKFFCKAGNSESQFFPVPFLIKLNSLIYERDCSWSISLTGKHRRAIKAVLILNSSQRRQIDYISFPRTLGNLKPITTY